MESTPDPPPESENTFGLSHEAWLSWKRKRRHTLIGCILIGVTIGIDCSVVMSTLLYYLRDLVKTSNPNLWYGLILASFFVSSTICGTFSGRWLDRTRRVRLYVRLSLLVQAVGSLVYTVPYHAVWLLVGRTICGIGDCFPSVIAGELFRIYTDEDSTRAVLWLHSVYSFGFIIGPAFNLIFLGLEFRVGSFEVNNLNIVGPFMSGLSILALFVSYFLIHDCSAILDLKASNVATNIPSKSDIPASDDIKQVSSSEATIISNPAIENLKSETEAQDELVEKRLGDTAVISNSSANPDENYTKNKFESRLPEESGTQTIPEVTQEQGSSAMNGSPYEIQEAITPSISTVFHLLLTNKDSLLIFTSSFLFMYTIFSADIVIPLIVVNTLQWKQTTLSLIYFIWGGIDLLVLLIIGKICTTNRIIYFTSIVCMVCQLITCLDLIGFKMFPRDQTRDIALMSVMGVTSTIGWSFDDVIIRVMFANMIPSEIQSFAETLRVGVSKIAIIGASLTVGVMFPCLHWWSSCIVVLNFVMMMGFVVRWKFLMDPKEMKFSVARTSTTVEGGDC